MSAMNLSGEMNESETLSDFLIERFRHRGEQAKFCRKTGIESGSITKWKKGKPPDFENCLKISDYFKLDPLKVFEMAGKPGFIDLYKRFFPEYQPKTLTEEDLYDDLQDCDEHRTLQQALELGSGREVHFTVNRLLARALVRSSQVLFEDFETPALERLAKSDSGLISMAGLRMLIIRELWKRGVEVPEFENRLESIVKDLMRNLKSAPKGEKRIFEAILDVEAISVDERQPKFQIDEKRAKEAFSKIVWSEDPDPPDPKWMAEVGYDQKVLGEVLLIDREEKRKRKAQAETSESKKDPSAS